MSNPSRRRSSRDRSSRRRGPKLGHKAFGRYAKSLRRGPAVITARPAPCAPGPWPTVDPDEVDEMRPSRRLLK